MSRMTWVNIAFLEIKIKTKINQTSQEYGQKIGFC